MASAVIVVTLLTVAASLASWLFGQWLARRARISAAALAMGGGGAVLLIGAVAFVLIGVSNGWQKLIPVQDPAPPIASATVPSGHAAEHPGVANVIPAAVVAQWSSTDCVAPLRSDDSSLWMLDNGCSRVLAVLFASCQGSEIACFTNELVSQPWIYEPRGILMTAANDRPVALRLGDRGPLVAPIFTIRDAGNVRRQIRYLACEVTAPGVLQALHESGSELTQQELTAELRADACYTQVLAWSSSGQRSGASPDSLLRNGID